MTTWTGRVSGMHVALACLWGAVGCTTLPLPTPAPVAPPPAFAHGAMPAPAGNGTAARAAGAATAGTPTQRPFAEVVKDATEQPGFLTVWRKDNKVWIEIHPDQFEQPIFLGSSLASGLGQQRLLPGLTGQEHVVVLRQMGENVVQLVARNLQVRAPEGSPLQRAVRESYSDSLLAAAAVVSAPHPQRKSVLVDAYALLGGDIAGALTALEAAYRLPYAHDRTNSIIERARADAEGISITMKMHFWIPKLPVLRGETSENTPQPPRVVPDARSLFLTYTYTLMPLPAKPMRPRRADERIGHFTDAFLDLGSELGLDARSHYINRWRLEKKDPEAAVSEPKEPIRVLMDRNIPEKYRASVRAGILEWNLAFERAGFRNALAVQQQSEDDDGASTDHGRHIAVRWFVMDGAGAMAVGPSQTDPRSGEILRAAVIIPENWVRFSRALTAETLPKPSAATAHAHQCSYAHDALDQLGFGLDLLAERGLIDPHGPEADRFVFESLKEVVMHEMGHALGLRHNFKASSAYSLTQLRDAKLARERGLASSVMDYIPMNLPLEHEAASAYHMTTLGEYDLWAIEYAYTPFALEDEKAGLAKIAARRQSNPALAYATDEDVAGGIDPAVNMFDLGNDPLAWYQRRLMLSRELWTRTQARELKEGESYALYRRNVQRGLNQFSHVAGLAVKYIGGVSTSREVPGNAKGGALLVPVPAAKQREALQLVVREIFSAESFRFDPNFMQRLGVDQLNRLGGEAPLLNTDFSLPTKVLEIQRSVLDPLMSDTVAQRLADAESKVSASERRNLLSYADVQTALREAVWSELKRVNDIDSLRRNLQREHIKRLATALVRPSSGAATDVRAVHRQIALKLEADLRRALATGRGNPITRAHLSEALAMLSEALKAPLIKGAV